MNTFDVALIGGGILGLATALELSQRSKARLVVLEAERTLAHHQTGHNSGVIHSGLYYKPGSSKARNCVEGRELLYRFCAEHGIAHDRCGKIVVATSPAEVPALNELQRRGAANGLSGIKRLTPDEIRVHEPHAVGVAGLFVPQTGIVDYRQVAETYARLVRKRDGLVMTEHRVYAVRQESHQILLETTGGPIAAKSLINCAGLEADRVARLCNVDPQLEIIPFRGEYYELNESSQRLVKNLIYPVPDPRFPFLGVHFTRRITGGIEAGPNAVLALQRAGYGRFAFSARDTWQLARYRGFWRMAGRYWKAGCTELYRSWSKRAFVAALRRLVPELRMHDVRRAGAGVRAQAVERDGTLVDDFRIIESERMIHVLNAPSPAATASIAIGRTLAELAMRRLDLN